jgi:hypothetical protein
MTPENRDYILTLVKESESIADIIDSFMSGCDCAHCVAVDEYLTWVNIGEYLDDFDDRMYIEYPPKKLSRDFYSMYFDEIPKLWRKYSDEPLSTQNFYRINDALILHESDKRKGVRALKDVLGPGFYFTTGGPKPMTL